MQPSHSQPGANCHSCSLMRFKPLVAMAFFVLALQGCQENSADHLTNKDVPDRAEAPTEVEVSPTEIATQIAKSYADSILTLEVSNSSGDIIATGTCFVAVNPTWVWTNSHVLKEGAVLKARTKSGAYFDVTKVLKSDKDRDIAVLEIRAAGLSPCLIAREWPEQGSQCVVIGSPLGLDSQVTTGVVSSILDEREHKAVSFSAPISPGSSGSPLFDRQGKVIGICSQSIKHGQNLNIAIGWPEILAIAEGISEESKEEEESDLDSLFKKLTTEKFEGKTPVEKLSLLDEFISSHPTFELAIIEKTSILEDLGMFKEQTQLLASVIAEGFETPKIYQIYSSSLVSVSRERDIPLDGVNIAPAEKALALEAGNVENWIFLADAHRSNGNSSEASATLFRALRAFAPSDDQFTIEELLIKAKIFDKLRLFHELRRRSRETPEEKTALDIVEIEHLVDELECYKQAERLGHRFELDDPPFLRRWWLGRKLWINNRESEAIGICEINTAEILTKSIPGDTHRQLLAASEDLALWKIARNRNSDIGPEVDALLRLAEFKPQYTKMKMPLCLDFGWIFLVMLANQDWERATALLEFDESTFPQPDAPDVIAFYKGLYYLSKGERDLFQSGIEKMSDYSFNREKRSIAISAGQITAPGELRNFLIDLALEWNSWRRNN